MYESNILVRACLDALSFVNMIVDRDLVAAVAFSESHLSQYRHHKIMLPTKTLSGTDTQVDITTITALMCYVEPEKSEMAFLLTDGQRRIIANLLNNEVLRYGNKNR